MTKYLLFLPRAGFSDIHSQLTKVIDYCFKMNRVLLFHFKYSIYDINYTEYFELKNIKCDIIYDSNKIIKLIKDNKFSVFPNIFTDLENLILNIEYNDKMTNGIFNKKRVIFGDNSSRHIYTKNLEKVNISSLPKDEREEDVIIHSKNLGSDRHSRFFMNHMFLTEHVKKKN